jgi:3-oxoacyl-[acyl-carrier protein] reductase/pteridine reductase
MESLSLAGKSALVTGGARRLGRSIALALAGAGADVAITFRNSRAAAQATAGEIAALGRRSIALDCDLRSESSVRSSVSSAAEALCGLHILVNNAAAFHTVPLDQLAVAQWDEVFETNARGPFLMAREALPHLRASEGRIINIGSLGGLRAWPGHADYCASKAALHMLTQAMARAFAPQISVNCVAPGWIESDELSDQEQAVASRFAGRTPMRRNGSALDVAQAVLFFATGPHFITGQILSVDGGLGLV